MTFLSVAANITIGLIVIAMVCALIRLIKGPSLADRVVALDLMGMLGVSLLGVIAIAYKGLLALDVAIILAIVAFLSTVGFAHYLERAVDK